VGPSASTFVEPFIRSVALMVALRSVQPKPIATSGSPFSGAVRCSVAGAMARLRSSSTSARSWPQVVVDPSSWITLPRARIGAPGPAAKVIGEASASPT